MSFKKKKYLVIKNAISKELAEFCFHYFLIKRKVADTLITNKHISEFNTDWGTFKDVQVPGVYSHYADIVMETLLVKVKPIMEKKTKLKLLETYSYARFYEKNSVLKKHKDRKSCEISTTMFLGGDPWPIYVEPDSKKGKQNKKSQYIVSKSKGHKVDLAPGDMLVYRGCDLEHWRNKFKGNYCAQVFLHYNDRNFKHAEENKFDKRLHLGLPNTFKNR
tara:strand:- start:851 stop:1507 length:657 start_codon:yes stop_codon:yes gene_type:complete